ncbi:hypothetical protein ABK040_005220 [Willaertia magna]
MIEDVILHILFFVNDNFSEINVSELIKIMKNNINNLYLINKLFYKCCQKRFDDPFFKKLLFKKFIHTSNLQQTLQKQKLLNEKLDYKNIYSHINHYFYLELQKQQLINKKIKLAICGDGGCGKTSIICQFIFKEFHAEYDPTLYDCLDGSINLNDTLNLNVTIFDQVGMEEWIELRYNWMRNTDAFIIVCNLTNEETLSGVYESLRDINISKNLKSVPIVIVGNKLDLLKQKNERKITKEKINETVIRIENNDFIEPIYIETSAKERINVEEIFIQVVLLKLWNEMNGEEIVKKYLKGDNIFKEQSKCIVM